MNNNHEVLIGPYRSGKSWLLLERALQHCLNSTADAQSKSNLDGETIIIVPSQRYRRLVETRLNKLVKKQLISESVDHNGIGEAKISGLWGLKIISFYQFCQASLLQAGIFARLLPEAAKGNLIAAVCRQLMQAGKISKLQPILNSSGTQASILSLIDEWQRAGYAAGDIIEKVRRTDNLNIHSHHQELAEIFVAYQDALKELNYADEHGLVLQLTDFLLSNKQINWLSNFIAVDGFDRLNFMQLNLLNALSQHTKELYVSFDYEPPQANLFEEYAWKIRSHEQIKEHLAGSFAFKPITKNNATENNIGKNNAEQKPAIKKQKAEIETEKVAIETLAASDRLSEMAIIAARVKAAIIIDKVKASEIVVTARNFEPYKSAIEAAFKDAGLDYYIDEPIQLKTLPIIRFIMSLLALEQDEFKRRQVVDCLRSPYFAISKFALTKDDIELANTLSLDKKVVAGRQQWQQALQVAPNSIKKINAIFDSLTPPKSTSDAPTSIPDAPKSITGVSKSVSNAPKSTSDAIDYVRWVEDLIEKVIDLSALDAHLEPTLVWKQKEALAQFRRQLALLIQEENLLKQLKQGFSVSSYNLSSYYERLSELIEKANFAAPPHSPNQVLIASAELVPNQKYRQIYLAGLLEGEFPAIKTTTGFLTGQELEQWRRLGVYIYNPRLEAGFEYALFASLINRASEKLILSYPSIEISSSKDELLPSFFFNALDINPENAQPISFAEPEIAFTSPRNALAYSFWQGQRPAELIISNLETLANFADNLQEKFSFAEIRSKQLQHSPVNGYLVDHVAASTTKVILPEYWNAGQLNDYGKCPFNFWLSRMLKITPHQEPEIGLSVMDRGTLYHKALELFYQNVIDNKITINLNQEKILQEAFKNAVLGAIDWIEKEAWFRPNEFWPQEKNTLAFKLNNFFAAEFNRFVSEMGQYQPYTVEATFGPDNQYPPLTLTKNGKTIKIRGKIDRIDIETNSLANSLANNFADNLANSIEDSSVQNKKLRVIDYKSGSTFISRDDFESGRNLQLPIYALAAENSILPGSRVSAFQYLSIGTGKVLSSKKQDEISIREDLNHMQEKVFAFVENIEKGDFSVKPSNEKLCVSCIHKTVCRIKEFPNR